MSIVNLGFFFRIGDELLLKLVDDLAIGGGVLLLLVGEELFVEEDQVNKLFEAGVWLMYFIYFGLL